MNDSQLIAPGTEAWTQADEIDPASAEEVGEPLGDKVARFLRRCWSKRWLIIAIFIAGTLYSLLRAISSPNYYTSTTTLMPPDNSSPLSGMMSMLTGGSSAASLGSEALGLSSPGDLFIGVLGSRTVQDDLVSRFNLMRYYHANVTDDARRMLANSTTITQDRMNGIISISVTAGDPVLASKLAQGYVTELNAVMSNDSTSAARRERIFLEERLKEVKQNLDVSAKALSEFSSKSGAIDIPNQARSMMDAGLRLQTELIDGRSQLAALRQTYSADNARVRAVEARNAELERELDKMSGLQQSGGSTSNQLESAYPSVDQLPALGVTYYDLERKVQVEEALWETLTKEYEFAKVEEVKEIPTARVLDAANIPVRKSGPIRRKIVLMGMAVSIVVAFLAVFAIGAWEQIDPQSEPKKLILEIAGAAVDSKRLYWKLPGMKQIHSRFKR